MSQHLTETTQLKCDKGTVPSPLSVTSQSFMQIEGKLQATEEDKKPNVNIKPFGVCSITRMSCNPVPVKWQNTSVFEIDGKKELLDNSTCQCAVGGKISPIKSAQTFVEEGGESIYQPIVYDYNKKEDKEDNTEYVYYTKDGFYLGGNDNSAKVYLSTQGEYDKAKKDKKWSLINKESNLLKENGKSITNTEFSNNAYLVHHEASLTGDKYTALWIAHTINNALNSKYNRGKKTFNQLFKTGYSSVKAADKMKTIKTGNKSQNEVYSRFAVINVLLGGSDPTGKAYFWDGLDLFTRKGELDHPKFKQYKSVTIYASHLKEAIDFWNVLENKRKVNPSAKINSIFEEEYELKKVADGAIKYDDKFFTGARKDSQNTSAVSEDLISTGFKSGTMFWTTYKGK